MHFSTAEAEVEAQGEAEQEVDDLAASFRHAFKSFPHQVAHVDTTTDAALVRCVCFTVCVCMCVQLGRNLTYCPLRECGMGGERGTYGGSSHAAGNEARQRRATQRSYCDFWQ